MSRKELNLNIELQFKLLDQENILLFIIYSVVISYTVHYFSTLDIWTLGGIIPLAFLMAFLDFGEIAVEEVYEE